MRRLRSIIDRLVIYAGVLLVLGMMIFAEASLIQTAFVLFGLLLVELGVWRVASQLLPNARTNQRLRDEVNRYVDLVREMYRVANANDGSAFEAVSDELRARTDGVIAAAKVDLA